MHHRCVRRKGQGCGAASRRKLPGPTVEKTVHLLPTFNENKIMVNKQIIQNAIPVELLLFSIAVGAAPAWQCPLHRCKSFLV